MSNELFIGVDVGTSSVRAALVTKNGNILTVSTKSIKIWTPKSDYFEQSSTDIWNSCCFVVKDVIQGRSVADIKGIGFDATCSLVVIGENGKPLSASLSGNDEQNVIMWMDHRASEEANYINSLKSQVLDYVGGKISLEMEIPKLMWLKKNLYKQCWEKAGLLFDLPDFLTWKATGSETRSLCSLVCKWTYLVEANGTGNWCEKFFMDVGLDELMSDKWRKIGSLVQSPGSPCGDGLTVEAANELGLLPGTAVGSSMIDAHAGGLGMIGCAAGSVSQDFETRLGLICGTSTCHMAVSKAPIFVPGVWGPYYSAMLPGFWLNEGGQSATGKLIDHIIDSHPISKNIRDKLEPDMHIITYLNNLLKMMACRKCLPSVSELTHDVHMWPDFHGNRSPLADPSLRGMICGLTLASDEESLAVLYLATIQSLAYGTVHIIQQLKESGHKGIQSVVICGGLSRNPLFVQTQADAANLPVLCPKETESVMLGAAMLGACAAGTHHDVMEAAQKMSGDADIVIPREEEIKYHAKKYSVFLKMLEHQREYRRMMSSK